MAAPEAFFLVIRAPNGDVREVALEGAVVIGRDESSDVRVEDKKVSRRHAAFKLIEGKPYVEDLGSSNGVKLDGARIEKRARVDVRSEVRVGGYVVTLRVAHAAADRDPTSALVLDELPGAREGEGTGPMVRSLPAGRDVSRAPGVVLVGVEKPVEGRRFELRAGDNVVGRLEECDVGILDPSVSRQHARIRVEGPRVVVHDLGSANGVFVEDVRIVRGELARGDRLRIGEVELRVDMPRDAVRRPLDQRIDAVRPAASGRVSYTVGILGLLLAAGLVAAALFVQRPTRRTAARNFGTSTTTVPSVLATYPAETEPSERPVPEVTARPVEAPTPAEPSSGTRARTRTATSPWSPRGPDGLPLDLPVVDTTLDHASFVSVALGDIRGALEDGRREDAGKRARELLDVDPIHPEARALIERLAELAAADEALARAEALVARGDLADAYGILAAVPDSLPQAETAKKRAEALRTQAVADALARGRREARRSSTWRAAHEHFQLVLTLDPRHEQALTQLRALEAKMRKRKMAFDSWRPPEAGGNRTEKPRRERLIERYGPVVGPIVERYVRGDAKGAQSSAERRRRRARGETKAQLGRFIGAVKEVRRRYPRVRTEIANDPSQAWALLIDLEETERRFLPSGVRSYLVEELRADLSDAFAKQGETMFDTRRYEAAFQRWEAGFKLDPRNTRVLAGLGKLLEVAKGESREGRVAVKRGANASACERFRLVTRITRSDSEVHREARKQAFRACP